MQSPENKEQNQVFSHPFFSLCREIGFGGCDKSGRVEAKAKGIKFGRKRTIDRKKLLDLHKEGVGATKIAQQMGIARSTVYKLLAII